MSHKPQTSPALPWNVKLFVSTLSFAVDVSRRSNGTINRRLMSLFDFKSSPSNKPHKGVKSSDIIVDTNRDLWFRLYIPTTTTDTHGGDDANNNIPSDVSLPVIVYFHGGGFSFMAPNSKPYNDLCQRLAREIPAVIISVNYRLAPEHRYPCQVEDGFDVLKFINDTKVEGFPSNANLRQCFLAGDSAGGNLVHHVALKASEYKFRNLTLVGLVAIQPFFGGEERTESETKLNGAPLINMERTDWLWKAFLPVGSDRDHMAVNVFGPNSVDISGVQYPATLVFVGGFDPLQDRQRKYYEGLKKNGKEAYLVEYENAIHWFYAFPELSESCLLIEEMRDFMQNKSAKL